MSLQDVLAAACKGLVYMSETDAAITPFTPSQVELKTLSEDPTAAVVSYQEFFARFTVAKEWWGEREKETAVKFAGLKRVLEENLGGLRVLKVGRVQIDIYVLGTDHAGNMAGVQTRAVET